MTAPLCTSTAPTGTSPAFAARSASASACAIQYVSSSAREANVTGPLTRRSPGDEVDVVALQRRHDGVPVLELPLEQGERERVLQQPLNGALERPCAERGIVALRRDE